MHIYVTDGSRRLKAEKICMHAQTWGRKLAGRHYRHAANTVFMFHVMRLRFTTRWSDNSNTFVLTQILRAVGVTLLK